MDRNVRTTLGNTYATAEWDVAAYLVWKGHEILSTESAGKRYRIVFAVSARADAEAYYNGASAPCMEYYLALEKVRDAAFGGRN